MSYYDTFIKSSLSPKDYYKIGLQELVDYTFDNASTYCEGIEEEMSFGTLQFKQCNVRVTTLVDAKTGQRVNDDYKKIIFKDINYNPSLGTRYRFDDNIWIVFSTDNMKTDTSAIYVRRCNNTMNWQDDYGKIHREPCIIDYKVNETQPFRQQKVDIPTGRIWVQCQLNDWTKSVNINNRFIFNGNPYKIRELHKFDKTKTFDENSSNIISFYADYDLKATDDNFELEIANYKKYSYEIISEDRIIGKIGDVNKISYSVVLNNDIINESVSFESDNTDITTVDSNGNYQIISSGECNIVLKMINNNDITKNIKVISSEDIKDEYNDVITPNIKNIKLNQTQDFYIYEYKNGVVQDTTFDISCCNIPCSNYKFKTDGNKFFITNLKTTEDRLLKIICVNNRNNNETIIFIKLGGVF